MSSTDHGQTLRPGIGPVLKAEIERLLRNGLPMSVVARRTGVSDTTVGRVRDEMRAKT